MYFGSPADQIQKILRNYPLLRWWMEQDGLVVDEVKAEEGLLSDFDRVAGSLVVEHWKDNGLSKSSPESIALRLDADGFLLKGNLQPARWKLISDYNQKHPRLAIKTFTGAVRRPLFAQGVRRRLYAARDCYKKAQRPAESIPVEI